MLKKFGFLAFALIAIFILVPVPQAKAGWGVGVQVGPAYPVYPPSYAYPSPGYYSAPYGYYSYPAYPPPAYYTPGYVYPYASPWWGGYYGSRGYRGGDRHYEYRGHYGRGYEGFRGGGHRR